MKKLIRFVFALCCFALISPAFADAPAQLPVQGQLLNTDGSALSDVFAVTFTLYADDTATTVLWSEELPVNFVEGYFTAYLGSTTAIDLALFRDNSTPHLGVKIGDDEEMPVFALATSPFSGFAQYAGVASGLNADATLQIVDNVAQQLENDGKVHDRYTDAEAVAAVTAALSTDTSVVDAALGAQDNNNPLNHARYTDAEAQSVADTQIAAHTAVADAHHTRYANSEAQAVADTQIAAHTGVVDAHHTRYTDAEALAAATACPRNTSAPGDWGVCAWHVGGYNKTFAQAAAICKSQGGRLCTLAEISTAQANGAQWCSWGWTADRTNNTTGHIAFPYQGSSSGCGSGFNISAQATSATYGANCCR